MKNSRTILALLFVALLFEGLLLFYSGLLAWLTSGPHSADELRDLLMDWRTAMSIGLVTLILWLIFSWFRLGAVDKNHHRKN